MGKDLLEETNLMIIYVSICFGMGGLVHFFLKNFEYNKVGIPYSTILIMFGILLGLICISPELKTSFSKHIIDFPAHELISMTFPALTFKMAFQMDAHIFLKSFTQILIISTIEFGLSSIILAYFAAYNKGEEFSTAAILFGLLASVSDTKDTIKFLGKFKNLGVLLAGEELITASLAFFLFELIFSTKSYPIQNNPIIDTIIKALLAIVTGLIIGRIFLSIISWDRCDFLTIVTISICIGYSVIYGLKLLLGSCEVLTLAVFGIILCSNKGRITTELERSLFRFWQLFYTLFNFVIYVQAGVLLVLASKTGIEGNDLLIIFMFYMACLITRTLMLLVLSPILSRIGYGMSLKNGAVLIWGALKGTPTVLLAFTIYHRREKFGLSANKWLIYAIGLVLLHLIINATTIEKVVKLLGFTTISTMKISNMTSILNYVMTARDRSINVLKMNKLYADAAWDAVREATTIVHPYQSALDKDGDLKQKEERGISFSTCPDCKKEVPIELTGKELQAMREEAYMRILKAKKVSYWRQFEWGMLSKEAHRSLLAMVNNAIENKVAVMDADSLKNMWKPTGCAVFFRNKFVKLLPKKDLTTYPKFPLSRWQVHLYKIVSSLLWEYSIFVLIILTTLSFAMDVVYRHKMKGNQEKLLITLSTVCFILLILFTFFKMLAIGCYNFMRSPWHLVDMVAVTFSCFYIFCVYRDFLSLKESKALQIKLWLSASRLIYAARFFRLYFIIQMTIPKIVEFLDRKVDVHLAHGYDAGKGFVTGQDEVLKLLPRFVSDEKVFTELKVKLEAVRLEMTKEIGILQRNRPVITMTVKTREVMASVLREMKATTKDLKDGGLLDDEEFYLISKAIDERQKFIRKKYLNISPCPPDVLLRQITWLIDDEDTATFFITHSLTVNLNYEEILIKADDEPQGIYIIVSGIARMNYKPNLKKLNKLQKMGALPNVDYPSSMNYRECQEDYIVSGNVVGEIGILTDRTHDSNITCASSVQAYFISIDVLKHAIKSQEGNSNGLQQRIWKAVAVRLACSILPEVANYQSWTQEKLQRYLERSFVPKLNPSKTFFFCDIIDAALLIEGRAHDDINKEMYFAPSYIPRTVQKLEFRNKYLGYENSIDPILLIVPAEDIDEQDLMDYLEGGKDFVSYSLAALQNNFYRATQRKQEGRNRIKIGLSKMEGTYGGGVRSIRATSSSFERFQKGLHSSRSQWSLHENTELEKFMFEVEHRETREDEKSRFSEWDFDDTADTRTETESKAGEVGSEKGKELEKTDDSENPDTSETYELSYFNYKPAYNTDLETESDEELEEVKDKKVENLDDKDEEMNDKENKKKIEDDDDDGGDDLVPATKIPIEPEKTAKQERETKRWKFPKLWKKEKVDKKKKKKKAPPPQPQPPNDEEMEQEQGREQELEPGPSKWT